jgi:hypothetical protein
MYGLGAILLLYITDAADQERPNAHIWLALTWPFITVLTVLEDLVLRSRGDYDDE